MCSGNAWGEGHAQAHQHSVILWVWRGAAGLPQILKCVEKATGDGGVKPCCGPREQADLPVPPPLMKLQVTTVKRLLSSELLWWALELRSGYLIAILRLRYRYL